MAAERDQVLDRRNVETEVARMADEGEAVEIASLVAPLVTLRPMRRADQPHLLVIADRRHFHAGPPGKIAYGVRSEEHTSELQSLMRISYAVFCLKKKNQSTN